MTRPAPWQARFLDQVGALTTETGLPPSTMRVFAWLVVCEPEHQTVDELRATLGLSAGAISTATTTLIATGLVERTTRPGDRRHHYRLRPGGWELVLRQRLDAAARLRATAAEAIAAAPTPQPRVAEMRDFYGFFADHMAELLAKQR